MKIKFKIHVLTYLLGFICFFTGQIKLFMSFIVIISVHELGHVFGALINNCKIDKIIILPFGGLTILKYPLNIKLYKEFIIVIMGPLFQIISFLLLKKYNLYYFNEINYFLLVFNLLPMIPLDGYRLLNIFFNKLICFKKSLYLSIYVSSVCIIINLIFLVFYPNFILLICLFFLLYKTYNEYRLINYIYNKFLFERYNNNLKFNKFKRINSIDKFYRDYCHLIYNDYRYFSEKEYLDNIYKKI